MNKNYDWGKEDGQGKKEIVPPCWFKYFFRSGRFD
jgi:hypothetical protein